jgi:hypothetical protein
MWYGNDSRQIVNGEYQQKMTIAALWQLGHRITCKKILQLSLYHTIPFKNHFHPHLPFAIISHSGAFLT